MLQKHLDFNISTPVFDGASESDILDTLDLANDYVNMEWDEFYEKYKDSLREDVMDYLALIWSTESCGRVFRFAVMVR